MISTLIVVQPAFGASVISIYRNRSSLTYGRGVIIYGTVSPQSAGQTVYLRRSIDAGRSYATIRTATTAADGTYSFTYYPDKTARYKVLWSQENVFSSNYVTVKVTPLISIHRLSRVWVGQKAKINGGFMPHLRRRRVYLQQYRNRHWIAKGSMRTDRYGNYVFRTTINNSGSFIFRVLYKGESLYNSAVTSRVRIIGKWRNPFKISAAYKHYIVVNKHNYFLYYLSYGKISKKWPCGVGMSGYSTPSGNFRVTAKRFHPTWYNPGASWSQNMADSIPWPSSPLGARALNISASGIRIHGTTKPWLLDNPSRAISHGCIRMKNPHVIWLYNRVPVGTKVKIF